MLPYVVHVVHVRVGNLCLVEPADDLLNGQARESVNDDGTQSFAFRQPSCRMLDDAVGIVNAYDSFAGVTKDGKVQVLHGRTTLVFGKRSGEWKIVSAHFSPLPQAS